MSFLLDRSCEILFLGMIDPNSSIVCWCCSPIGYTSACLSRRMQSIVIGMLYPSSMSLNMALST